MYFTLGEDASNHSRKTQMILNNLGLYLSEESFLYDRANKLTKEIPYVKKKIPYKY